MNGIPDRRPIGVFDSGLGGLTVLAALKRALPYEDFIYLGDTARVPYGSRSKETVKKFAKEDLAFLLSKDVKLAVAACNTVSALALDELKKISPVPVLGVIEPGAEAVKNAVMKNENAKAKVCVGGTRGTILSGAYDKAVRSRLPEAEIRSIPCPLLVPAAEEGLSSGQVTDALFELYFGEMKKEGMDVLLLGCTHYPVFREALREFLPQKTTIVDCADACAASVAEFLEKTDKKVCDVREGSIKIFVTDTPPGFEKVCRIFFGKKIGDAELVGISD